MGFLRKIASNMSRIGNILVLLCCLELATLSVAGAVRGTATCTLQAFCPEVVATHTCSNTPPCEFVKVLTPGICMPVEDYHRLHINSVILHSCGGDVPNFFGLVFVGSSNCTGPAQQWVGPLNVCKADPASLAYYQLVPN